MESSCQYLRVQHCENASFLTSVEYTNCSVPTTFLTSQLGCSAVANALNYPAGTFPVTMGSSVLDQDMAGSSSNYHDRKFFL